MLLSKKSKKEKVNCVKSGAEKLDFGQCVVFLTQICQNIEKATL